MNCWGTEVSGKIPRCLFAYNLDKKCIMNKKLLLFSAFMAGASWTVQAQDLVLSEGQYYTDATQTTPYTGRYTEFYDDGMLKDGVII